MTENEQVQSICEFLDIDFVSSDVLEARKDWDTYKYKKLNVPRVSNVLHACNTNTEALLRWANNLGYRRKNYVREREIAAVKGTLIHNSIEEYIESGKVPNYDAILQSDSVIDALRNGMDGFIAFWNQFRFKDMIKNVKMEKTLVTPYYGGTFDLLITLVDGRNYLFDFKTSNNLQDHHFVQLSAYRYALEHYYNTHISGVSILKINKTKPLVEEFALDFDNPNQLMFINQCEQTFFTMLSAYYNSLRTAELFKDIKKEIKL